MQFWILYLEVDLSSSPRILHFRKIEKIFYAGSVNRASGPRTILPSSEFQGIVQNLQGVYRIRNNSPIGKRFYYHTKDICLSLLIFQTLCTLTELTRCFVDSSNEFIERASTEILIACDQSHFVRYVPYLQNLIFLNANHGCKKMIPNDLCLRGP